LLRCYYKLLAHKFIFLNHVLQITQAANQKKTEKSRSLSHDLPRAIQQSSYLGSLAFARSNKNLWLEFMRYLFFTTGAQPWFNLAAKLHDEKIATPVLWVGDPRHENSARQKFGEDVVESMDKFVHFPWRIRQVNYDGIHNEFFSSVEYYRAKDRALKMMDRIDIYGTFSRLDREACFKNICIWGLNRIGGLKPDCLIMTESPHSHAQYTLFEICRYLKIKVYKLKPWTTLVPILSLKCMDDGHVITPTIQYDTGIHQRIRRDLKDYICRILVLNDGDKYETKVLTAQRKASSAKGQLARFTSKAFVHLWASRIYHRIKFLVNGEFTPISPSFAHLLLSGVTARAKRYYLKRYHDAACEKNVDLTTKYVYFGLHYEPERTTNPDGGEFHDQLLALIKLRNILPDDVQIYVKEHPSQFYRTMRGLLGRSPIFYEQIKNIKGVKLIGQEIQSLSLTRNAQFVSTISGSVAIEAAILGKRALIFGDAWFTGMPNVTEWKEDLKYNEILLEPLVEHDEILNNLLKEFDTKYIIGCQNTSAENRFKSYISPEFREIEAAGLLNLFTELSNSLKEEQRINYSTAPSAKLQTEHTSISVADQG